MFHELAINCRNFSFSKKGRSDCAGRRISIRKGGEAMGPLAGSVVTCAYDANGNITEYVSGSGEILSHNDYSAFGRELIKTGSDDFTHRFSTKPYCRKTGMVEFQLRRYRPRCGRWMNRDAIEEDGGLNLYGYVGNGVLMNVDLLGNECFCGEEISAVLAVGPIDALTAKNLAVKALKRSNELSVELGGGIHNGPADAFRHCYWSCLMAKEIGDEQAKEIGDIHENCASNQDSAEASMDFHNNAKGREVAVKGNCEEGCKEALKEGVLQCKKKRDALPKHISRTR